MAHSGLGMLANDARRFNQLLQQYMSNGPTAQAIDLEVGDLRYEMLGTQSLLSYIDIKIEPFDA